MSAPASIATGVEGGLPEWWRPDAAEAAGEVRPRGGRLAFGSLLAFTFVLFLSPQEWVPALAPLRIAMLATLGAVLGHLVDRWRQPARLVTLPEHVMAAALLAWAAVTLPLSIWPGGSFAELSGVFLKSLVVFWLLGRVVNRADRLATLAWMLTLMSIPIALGGLMHYRAGDFVEGSAVRIEGYGHGLAANPNDLALTLDIILPITLALLATARSMPARVMAAAAAMVSVAGVVVTFSRGGFVALAAILGLAFVWLLRRRPLLAASGVLAVALIAPPVLPAGYLDRLATVLDIQSDPTNSAQERVRDMHAALQLIHDDPIFGAGIGMDILALNGARGDTWRQVHDVYLEYGVDLGLVGLALFVCLLGSSIRTARRAERAARDRSDERFAALAAAIRVSLLGFAIAAVFYPVGYYFYFYYLAGLATALRRIQGSTEP